LGCLGIGRKEEGEDQGEEVEDEEEVDQGEEDEDERKEEAVAIRSRTREQKREVMLELSLLLEHRSGDMVSDIEESKELKEESKEQEAKEGGQGISREEMLRGAKLVVIGLSAESLTRKQGLLELKWALEEQARGKPLFVVSLDPAITSAKIKKWSSERGVKLKGADGKAVRVGAETVRVLKKWIAREELTIHEECLQAQLQEKAGLQKLDTAIQNMLYNVLNPDFRAGADIEFEGNIVEGSSWFVISFPGIHKKHWDKLISSLNLSTCCVFFPGKHMYFGKHLIDPENCNGACYCIQLYGGIKPWGCMWFGPWIAQLIKGILLNQQPIVLKQSKDHPLARHPRRLGFSQEGEVAYAKRYLEKNKPGMVLNFQDVDRFDPLNLEDNEEVCTERHLSGVVELCSVRASGFRLKGVGWEEWGPAPPLCSALPLPPILSCVGSNPWPATDVRRSSLWGLRLPSLRRVTGA
jgi:hypothetical protein